MTKNIDSDMRSRNAIAQVVRGVLRDALPPETFVGKTNADRADLKRINLLPDADRVGVTLYAYREAAVAMLEELIPTYSKELLEDGSFTISIATIDNEWMDINETSAAILKDMAGDFNLNVFFSESYNWEGEAAIDITIGFIDKDGELNPEVLENLRTMAAKEFVDEIIDGGNAGKTWTVHDTWKGFRFNAPFRDAVTTAIEDSGYENEIEATTVDVDIDGANELGTIYEFHSEENN